MTKPGCSDYCLSHQLLFFLLARMVSAEEAWPQPKRVEADEKGLVAMWSCMLHTGKVSRFLDLCFGHPEGEVRVACHPPAIQSNQPGWGQGRVAVDLGFCWTESFAC